MDVTDFIVRDCRLCARAEISGKLELAGTEDLSHSGHQLGASEFTKDHGSPSGQLFDVIVRS